MKRRTFLQGVATTPTVIALPFLTAKERYRFEAALAQSDMMARIVEGEEFDAELARFELQAQLLREKHNVFLWDGPTTARGYRHASWPREA